MARTFGVFITDPAAPIASGTSLKALWKYKPPSGVRGVIRRIRTTGHGTNPAQASTNFYLRVGVDGSGGVTAGTLGAALRKADARSTGLTINSVIELYSANPTIDASVPELLSWAQHPQGVFATSEEIIVPAGHCAVMFCLATASHGVSQEIQTEE